MRQLRNCEQDPDVLDTWFSSALWPISTLGWPEPGKFPEVFPNGDLALKTWNPSNTLSTAREIITLWVSRMVMFNLYFRDCLPFGDVFIHAMIQDGEGRKMSKSLGNGVDPLDIIHSHGADAMRFTLASMTTQTQDVRMPVEKDPATGRNTSPKFDNGRNFSNKIWQASTGLAIPNLEGYEPQALQYASLPLEDRWILSRLQTAIQTIDAALSGFQFADASQECYRFFWNELCDWYLEMVKPRLRGEPPVKRVAQQVLAWVLDQSLRLLHPFMPFLTEALWKRLDEAAPQRGIEQPCVQGKALIRAAWPKANAAWQSSGVETQMARLQEIIRAVRDAVTRVNERRSAQKQPTLRNLPTAVIRTDAELGSPARSAAGDLLAAGEGGAGAIRRGCRQASRLDVLRGGRRGGLRAGGEPGRLRPRAEAPRRGDRQGREDAGRREHQAGRREVHRQGAATRGAGAARPAEDAARADRDAAQAFWMS